MLLYTRPTGSFASVVHKLYSRQLPIRKKLEVRSNSSVETNRLCGSDLCIYVDLPTLRRQHASGDNGIWRPSNDAACECTMLL